jgi:TatD DNase family protein
MDAQLVDFHCHLDLYPDPAAAVAEAEAAGVYTLTVTTTPKAWPGNLALTRDTRYVRAALGLHPQLVAERSSEIALWEHYLGETHYVGEVGLDAGPKYYRSFELQVQIFERILRQCAKAGGKVLTVHSVRAATKVLDLIEANLPSKEGLVVLHWFTGSKSEARRAVDVGCYFSVNAQMLQTDKGRDLVRNLPSDRLLTETDGPFTQIGGRSSHPRDIAATIEKMADLRQIDSKELAIKIRSNLKTILSTAGAMPEKG